MYFKGYNSSMKDAFYMFFLYLNLIFAIIFKIYFSNFLITEPPAPRFSIRRKSVFAEAYDPENDADDDEGATAVFPKSDEQRARLVESVKNVLLFRSLEKEQVSILLFYFYFYFTFLDFII